mgnify:CR=1 FL=1
MKSNMLAKAIKIASCAHSDQTDKAGRPYILHPIRVMQRLRTNDEELMQIAIMHDLIEDTPISAGELLELGFSERVMTALDCLTHKEGENYNDYIKRISQNKDAILVKIEDLRDNSDITRLKGLSEKGFKRIEKYNKAFVLLKNSLENLDIIG